MTDSEKTDAEKEEEKEQKKIEKEKESGKRYDGGDIPRAPKSSK